MEENEKRRNVELAYLSLMLSGKKVSECELASEVLKISRAKGEKSLAMLVQSSIKIMKREASATRRAQNSLSKMVASFEQGDKYAETVTKAVTDGATQAVEETVQAGTKAINEVAKKSAKSIEKLEQAANARAKRFMRITKPEVMVNIAIWIAVAVASAIILSFCYEFFTK